MLSEFDFSKGTRGKYATRFKNGTNIIVLEPDLAKARAIAIEALDQGTAEATTQTLAKALAAILSEEPVAGKG